MDEENVNWRMIPTSREPLDNYNNNNNYNNDDDDDNNNNNN